MAGRFGAVVTAMVTPFRDDHSLDLGGARTLASHLFDHGSDTLVVAGSTGESPTLSHKEKLQLFGAVIEAAKGRGKVVCGTGTYSTAETLELSRQAEKLGADGLLLVTPYYNKPPQRGLVAHYTRIASAVSIPIEVYSGDDWATFGYMCLGAVGVVSVASHLVGDRIRQLTDLVEGGDIPAARKIHEELSPLFNTLFITTNPIPVKTALGILGLPAGPPRLPLVPATKEERARIEKALVDARLL